MPADFARASDGSEGTFASPSGLVGRPNAAGFWVCWIPAEGIIFESHYYDMGVAVMNRGSWKYDLILNGQRSVRSYFSRWARSRFFDAAGNAVAGFEDAKAPGAPNDAYMEPGPVAAGSEVIIQSTQTTGAATTAAAQAYQRPALDGYTRSSDGRDDVWPSHSGMVGTIVGNVGSENRPEQDVWMVWKPAPNVTYQAHYRNADIRMKNNGNGTYTLDRGNGSEILFYDSRYVDGQLYDGGLSPISSPDAARRTGDVAEILFTAGQPAGGAANPGTGGFTPPPATGPDGTPTTVPYDGGGVVYSPFPDPSTFPQSEPTGGASSGTSKGILIALAAGAALLIANK